jgi:nitrite reductase/ring-hydroxylating ferredoxin subunit
MAFVRVASLADVPEGRGLHIEHGGTTLALFKLGDGRLYACGAACPHEDGPLAEGWIEGDVVVCPWHGYDFELTTGRGRAVPEFSVPVYPVRVVDTAVEVDLP